MNKDQIKGKVEELKGRARQALGTAKEAAKGAKSDAATRFEHAREAVEEKAGDAKETLERKRHESERPDVEKGEPGSDGE